MTEQKKELGPNGQPLVDRIDEITPEMEVTITEVCNEWKKILNKETENGDTSVKMDDLETGLRFLYKQAGYELPRIEIVDSPKAAIDVAKTHGITVTNTDSLGLGYWAEWHCYYDIFTRWNLRGVADNESIQLLSRFLKAGPWDCLLMDELALVSKRPKFLKTDERGRVHCINGPAMEFDDGFKVYMWHGMPIYKRYIENPESLTQEEILKDDNSERVRALAERLGWDRFLQKLDTYVVDTYRDEKTSLTYDLIDFKNRKFDRMPRLLKMQSPVLVDGQQPYYVEPVDPALKTAAAARKWQFSKPTTSLDAVEYWTVDECNNDPFTGAVFAVEA
jgi:hypothetical protein